MPRGISAVLVCILIGVTAFSVYRFVSASRENFDLTVQMEGMRADVSALQDEKDRLMLDLDKERLLQKTLSDENLLLRDEVAQASQAREDLQQQLADSESELEELGSQIAVVKAENAALLEQTQTLKADLARSAEEKRLMAEKLGSVAQLKQAIRDLRRQARLAASRPAPVRRVRDAATGQTQIIVGNRGFLVRDGKPTYEGRVRIDVQPQPQEATAR